MIKKLTTLCFALLILTALSASMPASAQETRAQGIAGMRKVSPKEMDATYSRPAPFAQKLVDQALEKHPEVLLLAIHAQPKGHKNLIVASNFGRIGKIGDDDDMRCIHTGKSNLEVNEAGNHFEDELALRDRKGRIVGALGVVFHYHAGADKARMIAIANAIGREMQSQIASEASLFGDTK